MVAGMEKRHRVRPPTAVAPVESWTRLEPRESTLGAAAAVVAEMAGLLPAGLALLASSAAKFDRFPMCHRLLAFPRQGSLSFIHPACR